MSASVNAIHINVRIRSALAVAAAVQTVTPLSPIMIIIIQLRLQVELEIELGAVHHASIDIHKNKVYNMNKVLTKVHKKNTHQNFSLIHFYFTVRFKWQLKD